ncbi:hypothetical protein PF008_g23853 [Phytophthora fragariae]|uniref:Uncharacterized protein n=1 Tax=Phytophthora fragariae TaxID=53985 RepID=A0A6G0QQK3_9STRA|nr:hypothetical protein PF008_g23853 [Phytophthora fragariae]
MFWSPCISHCPLPGSWHLVYLVLVNACRDIHAARILGGCSRSLYTTTESC